MTYYKDKTIRRGEAVAKKYKTRWMIFGIISLAISVTSLIAYFLAENFPKGILEYIGVIITFLVFGIFAVIYSRSKRYDYLLEGCKDIQREYEHRTSQLNKDSLKKAEALVENTGKSVNYPIYKTTFKYGELYNKLLHSDSADYVGAPQATNMKPKIILKSTPKQNDNNHNFDENFTDEEFDDLMYD